MSGACSVIESVCSSGTLLLLLRPKRPIPAGLEARLPTRLFAAVFVAVLAAVFAEVLLPDRGAIEGVLDPVRDLLSRLRFLISRAGTWPGPNLNPSESGPLLGSLTGLVARVVVPLGSALGVVLCVAVLGIFHCPRRIRDGVDTPDTVPE